MIDSNKFYYDKLLFDQTDSIRELVFPNTEKETMNETALANEKTALSIIRYALEYYLEWTPAYTMEHLDIDVLKKLRLYNVAMFRINYPKELEKIDSPRAYYIVCKLYPDIYHYDSKAAVIAYYKKHILIGGKYTNSFFDPNDEDGKERACSCLMYAINEENWLHSMSPKNLYAFFSGEKLPEARMTLNEFLINYHFKSIIDKAYAKSALDFLHAALPSSDKNSLRYYQYRFTSERRKKK